VALASMVGDVVTLPCRWQAVGLESVGVRLDSSDRADWSDSHAPTPTKERLGASAPSTPQTPTVDRISAQIECSGDRRLGSRLWTAALKTIAYGKDKEGEDDQAKRAA
jgi:hypothetical protein